jgi:hypothetical protein
MTFLLRRRTRILTDTDLEYDGGEYGEEIGTATNADTSQSVFASSAYPPNKPRRSILYHFAELFVGFSCPSHQVDISALAARPL